jgi:hypothetical protein
MSLDVYLNVDAPLPNAAGSGIFLRENGSTREITRAEWAERFPGTEPVVALAAEDEIDTNVYSRNVTHNLGKMAEAAGIYNHLWRPEEIGVSKAVDLIEPLTEGLAKLKLDPKHFAQFNSPNGWGLYEHFVPFVEDYLKACKRFPTATVSVSR